jgi:hypothetical protein
MPVKIVLIVPGFAGRHRLTDRNELYPDNGNGSVIEIPRIGMRQIVVRLGGI